MLSQFEVYERKPLPNNKNDKVNAAAISNIIRKTYP